MLQTCAALLRQQAAAPLRRDCATAAHHQLSALHQLRVQQVAVSSANYSPQPWQRRSFVSSSLRASDYDINSRLAKPQVAMEVAERQRLRLWQEGQRLRETEQQLVQEGVEPSHPRWQALLIDQNVLLEKWKAYNLAMQQQSRLLTLREAVQRTLPTLEYQTELSLQTVLSSSGHMPQQLKQWEDFAPGTERFVAHLPDTSPVLTPPRAVDPADQPNAEETMIWLLDKYHFTYLRQLGGGRTGLPEVDYAWYKRQTNLAGPDGQAPSHKSCFDRGWVWRNPATGGWQLIVAAQAKQAFSLPFRPGWDLVDEYNSQATPGTKPSFVALQLMQLCGRMVINGLQYGVLYSDRGFWFAKYCKSTDVLWVSQCVAPGQRPPLTLVASILYLVHLAVAEASAGDGKLGAGGGGGSGSDSGDGSRGSGFSSSKSSSRCCLPRRISLLPAMSHIQGCHASSTPVGFDAHLSMMLSGATCDFTDTLMLGPRLGYGSTGSVHEALLPGRPAPVVVKVAEDREGAQARLLQEVSVYMGPLAGLQGEVVPLLLGSGIMEVPGGQLPFLALPLLGPSLEDATAPLLPEEEESVVEGLVRIHAAGVLHGDVRLANVVLPGDDASRTDGGVGRPRAAALWVDFSHASVFETAAEGAYACADELAQCRSMLQELRVRHARQRMG